MRGESGLHGNDGNGKRNGNTETETQKVDYCVCMLTSALVYRPYLRCCHSSCLLRGLSSCFCSCSVWYAATSVPRSRSLMAVTRSVCSFIYSVSGDQDCIIISSDLLLARMKTCCQSRSKARYRTRNGQTERKSTVTAKCAVEEQNSVSPLPSM